MARAVGFGLLEARLARCGDEGRPGFGAAGELAAGSDDAAFGPVGSREGGFGEGTAGVGVFPVAAGFDRGAAPDRRFEAAAEAPAKAVADVDDLAAADFEGDRQAGRGGRVPLALHRDDAVGAGGGRGAGEKQETAQRRDPPP